ncbi:hypothetical protein A2U01_0070572, partial [Trifolium medium]|nr:hypothetical protein [Trifolium medium]
KTDCQYITTAGSRVAQKGLRAAQNVTAITCRAAGLRAAQKTAPAMLM